MDVMFSFLISMMVLCLETIINPLLEQRGKEPYRMLITAMTASIDESIIMHID
jgi:hypothetical protein